MLLSNTEDANRAHQRTDDCSFPPLSCRELRARAHNVIARACYRDTTTNTTTRWIAHSDVSTRRSCLRLAAVTRSFCRSFAICAARGTRPLLLAVSGIDLAARGKIGVILDVDKRTCGDTFPTDTVYRTEAYTVFRFVAHPRRDTDAAHRRERWKQRRRRRWRKRGRTRRG